jgi:hypothetical protein
MVVRMEYERCVEKAFKEDVLNKMPKVLLPISVLFWVVVIFFWRYHNNVATHKKHNPVLMAYTP